MKQKGFTLIEMVVVLAVVAILAAILVPTIAKNIQDANITRAQNETQVIAAAMASFYKDLGRWPTEDGTDGNMDNDLNLLYTDDGAQPADDGNGAWNTTTPAGEFEDHLVVNDPNGDGTPNQANEYPTTGKWRWRGPYLADITQDPFGCRYACNVQYLWNTITNAVYVLSAGPDRTWNTGFTQALPGTIGGDDIGTPVK